MESSNLKVGFREEKGIIFLGDEKFFRPTRDAPLYVDVIDLESILYFVPGKSDHPNYRLRGKAYLHGDSVAVIGAEHLRPAQEIKIDIHAHDQSAREIRRLNSLDYDGPPDSETWVSSIYVADYKWNLELDVPSPAITHIVDVYKADKIETLHISIESGLWLKEKDRGHLPTRRESLCWYLRPSKTGNIDEAFGKITSFSVKQKKVNLQNHKSDAQTS
jgi:hypothetical protein